MCGGDKLDRNMDSEEETSTKAKYCCNGVCPDDIVISGFGARFPWSENIEDFKGKLYSGMDFFKETEDRWKKGMRDISSDDASLVQNLDKFDNAFFGITGSAVKCMTPEQRLLQEVCYEAIADSGYNPDYFRGKVVSVYNATTCTDSQMLSLDRSVLNAFTATGVLNCMNANRFSYNMDLKGMSLVLDTACSSSMATLYLAVRDLLEGKAEAAVVCCSHLVFLPTVARGYAKLGIYSKTGRCRAFSSKSDGMVRGDCLGALFIQKASAARRIYAKIAACNFRAAGYMPEGLTVPSGQAFTEVFEKNLKEANLSVMDVAYIEAHGTGTTVSDPIEANAVDKVYCRNRDKPLLMGTIKTNIGHTEASSAFAGIIKCILALETGLIAPNLHFEEPNPYCVSIVQGRIQIVTKPTKLPGSIIAVSSVGIGGAMGQAVLEGNTAEVVPEHQDIPQLVLCSARREDGARIILEKVISMNPNREFYALFHELAYMSSTQKPYRGYTIMSEHPDIVVKQLDTRKRNVWFILTGMGCQYPGMGDDLMRLKVFADSMRKSAETLKPYGIDLLEYIKPGKNHFTQHRKITPSFVAICAIQIALIDVLKELGITPDGIVGHSTGELACAYADGCATAEQVMLSALFRGKVIEETELPAADMAAVGLTWEEAKKRCPKDVFAACHNAQDSVTISGLEEPLNKFMDELKKDNVFVRLVNAYGWGFHSELIGAAAPKLKASMEKVFRNPQQRSNRWRSSSYPPEEWHKEECKTIDANYFCHNLTSPVRFTEVISQIPKNAITIEIGPHFLLRSVLKRAIGEEAEYVGLMKRNENNVDFLLSSIAQLYTLGLDPKIQNLYPTVNYPVPRGTPGLADLVIWDHSVSWPVDRYHKEPGGCVTFEVDLNDRDSYLLDHFIDGRALYPATGYLVLAWECLATCMDTTIDKLPIIIEDFKILRATIIHKSESKKFVVTIGVAEKIFEIVEGGSTVATGKIYADRKLTLPAPEIKTIDPEDVISGREMYSDLKIRGYEYGPEFQCLDEVNVDGNQGYVKWQEKWVSYLDAHLLFFGLIAKLDSFSLPTRAFSVKINPLELLDYVKTKIDTTAELKRLPVVIDTDEVCSSPGVEIRGLKVEATTRRTITENPPLLEKYEFIPYVPEQPIQSDLSNISDDYSQTCTHVASKLLSAIEIEECMDHFRASFAAKSKQCADETSTLLMQTLHQITVLKSNEQKELDKLFEKYTNGAGRDIANRSLYGEDHLRIILEIIRENSSSKMTVVETCNGHSPIIDSMMQIVKMLPVSRLTGCLIHPDPDSLDKQKFMDLKVDVRSSRDVDYISSMKDKDIIVSSFLFGSETELNRHVSSLRPMAHDGSFVVFYHKDRVSPGEKFISISCKRELETQSCQRLEKILQLQNLVIISKFSDNYGGTLYLLRYQTKVMPVNNFVVKVKTGAYEEWVGALKDAHEASLKKPTKIWLVAEDCPCNGIVGLMKCLLQERPANDTRCIFIVPDGSGKNPPPFHFGEPFYDNVIKTDLVFNVYRKCWGSFRHLSIDNVLQKKLMPHSFLNIAKYGDLSSFKWYESPYKFEVEESSSEQNTVQVVYSALNFKDVMYATGKISSGLARDDVGNDPCVIGLEFSGINSKGRRVMGTCASRGIATIVHRPSMLCFDVPDKWTLEEAATVPVVYSTCYYALLVKGQLAERESVLIHSGAGGVGIAAIRIALSLNCEVFTTVGSEEKIQYLKKLFPRLKNENIGCSRDTSFERMIMKRTDNRGVDLILNSLADDKLQASTRCLANGGRFIEIGKYDLALDNKVGLGMFLKGASFHGVFLGKLMKESDVIKVEKLMYDGIASGVVQPLDRKVFPSCQVEDAFRFMSSGKHMGKVLLKIREEPSIGVIPEFLMQPAVPCTYFYKHKVYIVIGGLGGFGMALVQWLIGKGAVNIVITSRHGVTNGFQRLHVQRWKNAGANIYISKLNVGIKEDAKQLLRCASSFGPIGGIFNSAVVLEDAFLENQTAQKFQNVCLSKAEATINLDELTRATCPSLDLFVCFSSISCGKGNAGQSNYGYANSVMERVCERRRIDNLHGISIQWGIIGDVGVVHRNMGEDAVIAGVMAQPIKSCLDTLDYFLLVEHPVVTSYVNANVKKQEEQQDLLSVIAKSLGYTSAIDIDTTKTFMELGIDSMSGVEIMQTLELIYDLTLTVPELQNMKICYLQKIIESREQTEGDKCAAAEKVVAPVIINKNVNMFTDERLVQLNVNTDGVPLYFIHYSAEHLEKFQAIASHIDYPCYGILCDRAAVVNSISEMADTYLGMLTNNTAAFANIVIYSDAAPLGLEIIAKTKSTPGLPTILSCCLIDGALTLAKSLTCEDNSISKTAQEIESLREFLERCFSISDTDKVKKELECKYPEEKANCIRNMSSISLGKVNVENLIDSAKLWIQIQSVLRSYRPSNKLGTNLLAIESSQSLLANDVAFVKNEITKVIEGQLSLERFPGSSKGLFEGETVKKVANLVSGICLR